MTPFLTAIWSDLILASYAVPDDALLPYLAPGLELDRWERSAWCSLVAFDFLQTRVRGLSVPYPPYLHDFPEFNLRFYVRQGERRGVVFVREFVPSPIVAGVARLLYNEPYQTARMTSRVTAVGDLRRVRHDFDVRGKRQQIAVSGRGPATVPAPESFAQWVKEQSCGFGRTRGHVLTRYQVSHPVWRTYAVEDWHLQIDFAALYGSQWQFLQGRVPDSIVLAEGSAVSVYPNELSSRR